MKKYAYLVKKNEKGICTPFYFNDKKEMLAFAFNAIEENSLCYVDIYAYNDYSEFGGKKFWKYIGTFGNIEDGKYNGIARNKASRTKNINL